MMAEKEMKEANLLGGVLVRLCNGDFNSVPTFVSVFPERTHFIQDTSMGDHSSLQTTNLWRRRNP